MVGTLKVRNFLAVEELLEALGLDCGAALKAVGLDLGLFANRETLVLYADAARLLDHCGRIAGCDDFGLQAGMRQGAAAMGLTGLVSLNAMLVGDALDYMARGLKTSDTGGVFSYEMRGTVLSMSYVVADPDVADPTEMVDGAMAIVCNIMRQLCGPQWNPDRVALSRKPPREPQRFRQFFGAPVEFGAATARLVCDAGVLKRKVAGHNPHHMDILAPLFDAALGRSGQDFVATTRAVLKAQASGGRLTRARAAQALGLSEHVFVSRLADSGATFSDLAEEVKYELARAMIAAGREFRAIAGELGFADSSAFNRAFAKWSGQTPGRWRAAKGGARAAVD
jgi:AraC-like DNA-binding protein